MSAAPLWITLAAAGVGAAGALIGVVVTHVLADRRETVRWHRERQRQADEWAREDAARTYEHRRDAYLAFAEEWHRHYKAADAWKLQNLPDPPEDALADLYKKLLQVQIFGTEDGRRAAKAAFDALVTFAFTNADLEYAAFEAFQEQVRQDLGVPPGMTETTSRKSTASAQVSPRDIDLLASGPRD